MSFRSPTPDGLTISPNAAGFGGNPAATPGELEALRFWGRYQLTTMLPNVGNVDGVGVVGINPAANPAYSKLAPGDVALVQGDNAPSGSALYVCVDRGTVSGGDARWNVLGGGGSGVTQTIRDAHVIVVGQGGGAVQPLATLFAATPPPTNRLNLSATGDVESVTCDFLDSGDGAQLQLALAAAAAAGQGIDIRLRPCNIQLDSTTVGTDGFVVPQGCRLIGAGYFSSILVGTDGTGGTTQTVVTLVAEASIEDVSMSSPPPAAAPGGTQLGILVMGSAAVVRRCAVDMPGSTEFDRVQTYGIHCPFPDGDELIDECVVAVDSLADQPTPTFSRGISFGPDDGSSYPNLQSDSEVRNTQITSAGSALGSCSIGVIFQNMTGGRCYNVEHLRAHLPAGGAFVWSWSATAVITDVAVRGPRFIECRMVATDDESAQQIGIFVSVAGTPTVPGIIDMMIKDCVMQFTPNAEPNPAISKRGYLVRNAATDNTNLLFSTIEGCRSHFSNRGFVIDASIDNTSGRIRTLRMTDCIETSTVDGQALTPRGCIISGNGNGAGPSVTNVGVHNCDFSEAPATGVGLEIEDVGVGQTIVVGNNLTPNGGAALVDNGTGTEQGHNIL